MTSIFSSRASTTRARSHHKHHTFRPHHASPPPQPQWGVPEGTLAANALLPADKKLPLLEWSGQTRDLNSILHKGGTPWRAVLLNEEQLTIACQQSWIRPLEGSNTCGIRGGQSNLSLAWDRSRLKTAPTWQDFWDVPRHPGRRGLHFGARTTLEIALLADGIAPQDIYATLSTPAGLDRAFHKLDLLRPYIVWWSTPDDAAHIMQKSSALMTSAPMTEISAVSAKVKAGPAESLFVAQTNQMLQTPLYWAIPTNTPDTLTSTTLETLHSLSPHLEDMPEAETSPPGIILTLSENFWSRHGSALEQRFQEWYGHKP